MNNLVKIIAVAGLSATVAAPAFAQTEMSASMTCAEYKALSPEDQMTVAAMAIAEVHGGMDGMGMSGEPKAVEDSAGDTNAAEATDGAADAGSVIAGEARAVEPTGGNTVASNMTAEPMDEAAMEAFMVACDQNLDAMVSEAAAGLNGTK